MKTADIRINPEVVTPKFDRANHCRQIGSLGGRKTVDTYGRKYMSELGKEGFRAFCAKHELSPAQGAAAVRLMNDPDRRVKQPGVFDPSQLGKPSGAKLAAIMKEVRG